MPTLEKRVQALEKEAVERKHSEEMLTIAVRALVSKEAFEKLQETVKESQERNGKLFNVIINQNSLHNERVKDVPAQLTNHDKKIAELDSKVTELDGKVVELDGKVVGLQTEMRQRFVELDGKIAGLQTDVAKLQTTVAGLDIRVMGLDARVTELNARVVGLDARVTGLDAKVTGLQTETRQRFSGIETTLAQILARLPEKP